jgi:hypothetical protein
MGKLLVFDTGTVFGRLTVVGFAGKDKYHYGQHQCNCQCGRQRLVRSSLLNCGIVTSCGHNDCCSYRTVDLSGQRFGQLVVVRECRDSQGKLAWECVCDCGKSRIAHNGRLRSGHVTSCGCASESCAYLDGPGSKFGRLTLVQSDVGRHSDGSVLSEWSCDCGGIVVCSHYSVRCGARTKCGKKECRPEAFRLEGKRFGRLLVIRVSPETSRKDDKRCNTFWDCLCDCGKTCRVQTSYLTKGKRDCCGRGVCHWAWRGGKTNIGSEAWARMRLARVGISSRRGGYAPPYESWERVAELWDQCGGECSCCNRKRRGTLHLDHCHETGRLRGFVCSGCNTAIGMVGESASALAKASKYVSSQCLQRQFVLS